MKVRNKRSLREYEISQADYAKLVEMKIHRQFDIIDKQDTPKGKILIPKEIIEYQLKPKVQKITKPEVIKTTETKKK